jgi:hypothetical protein
MLALNGHQARRWEPKRLRLHLFTLPATIAHTGRQVRLHLAAKAPWVDLVNEGVRRLRALAVPGECRQVFWPHCLHEFWPR